MVFSNIRTFAAFTILLSSVYGFATESHAQSPTPRQRQTVKQIKTNIDRAGKQFKAKKLERAAEYIGMAIKQIDGLTENASPELLESIKPEYERLSNAHRLLTEAGQKLDELKPLPEPMTGGDGEKISFTKSVAPILVAKCGNCHVNRDRGSFSAATFEALDQSTTLAYGLPDDARLIQVIESGEMPKGGLKVEEAELKILRAWMKQGAKFDGQSIKQSLNEFATTPATQPRNAPMMATKPTGKETVSFGLDVAPILVENCAQCHINANPRGNFSMANFRNILRGGDGGSPIKAKDSNGSQIVKRLRGDGVDVMPPGGKLDDKLIDTIAKWIDEGAAYDGGEVRLETITVAAKAKANSQTHEELTAERTRLAGETWKLVMDEVKSQSIPSKNFLVTGSTNESRLTNVSQLCEKIAPKVASALRASTDQPLVKGNISVFVFDKRYDFSEFGKMVEQRDFPKSVSGHWGYTTIDAYVTVLMTRNKSAKDIEASLAHQIASLYVANLSPDLPRWFADGVGLWTAKKILSKDESMKTLDARAEAAFAAMNRPDDFVANRMPSDQAGLVGYLFVKQLRTDSSSYGKLFRLLGDGQSFEKSFADIYGKTPAQLLAPGNRRNNR